MKSILIKLKGHPHVQKGTAYTILFAMGFCHLLNDMIQSVIPAMYPVLKDNFGFTFAQIGPLSAGGPLPEASRAPPRHPVPLPFSNLL